MAIYDLDAATLAAGLEERDTLLRRYARAAKTNNWPAYPVKAISLGLPDWAYAAIQGRSQER